MTLTVTHSYVSGILDNANASAKGQVLPSHWDAAHVISGGTLVSDANGNLDFYVATTGSDSNPGTIGSPFATIQHAVNVASTFNYQNAFSWTVHVADGTYDNTGTGEDSCRLPQFYTGIPPGALCNIFGNNTTPTNTVVDSQFNGKSGFVNGSNVFLNLKGFQINAANAALFQGSFPGGILIGGNLTFGGTSDFVTIFENTGGVLDTNGLFTFTFLHNVVDSVFFGIGVPLIVEISFTNTTIVFPAPTFTCVFMYVSGQESSYITMNNLSYVNGGNVISTDGIQNVNSSILFTNNGSINDIPPFTYIPHDYTTDGTSQTVAINVFSFGQGIVVFNGSPFGSVASTTYYVAKSNASGGRYFLYDDGGTVYATQIGRTINTQTSTPYVLVLYDIDGTVEMNLAGANQVTVPSGIFPIGTEIRITQAGVGATTIAGAGGVTVHNAGALTGQWASAKIYQRTADEWVQLNGAY